MITIDVLGVPAPKGSVRAFFRPGMKRAMIVKDNKPAQLGWDANVRDQARLAVGEVETPPFVDRPLRVVLEFRLARPAGHWGKGKRAGQLVPSAPSYPRGKPDADKLARSTLDSLTGIVFDDDARIVELSVCKRYAQPGGEGARITVDVMPGSDARA